MIFKEFLDPEAPGMRGRIAGVLAKAPDAIAYAKAHPRLTAGGLAAATGLGYMAYNAMSSSQNPTTQTEVYTAGNQSQQYARSNTPSQAYSAPAPTAGGAYNAQAPAGPGGKKLSDYELAKEALRLQKDREKISTEYALNSIYSTAIDGYQ